MTIISGVLTAPDGSALPSVSIVLIAQAEQQKLQLNARADSEIAWRQDAVDLGIATVEETAQLTAWKQYRVQLNRIDTTTAPNITWQVPPVSLI